MSSSQDHSEREKILEEEKKKREISAEKEIESVLSTTTLRMMVSSGVAVAMDKALKVDRKTILIRVLRKLANKLEEGLDHE